MTEIDEDDERLLPGIRGFVVVSCRRAGVPEMDECLGLLISVAEFSEEVERVPVTCGGFGEPAGLLVDVTEAVPGGCLAVTVAKLAVQGQALLADRAGLVVVAEQEVAVADVVQGMSLPGLVGDGPEQGQRLPGMAERLGVAALALGQHAPAQEDPGLPRAVAELAVEAEAQSST